MIIITFYRISIVRLTRSFGSSQFKGVKHAEAVFATDVTKS
jgi:hypothetical protein